MILGSVTGKQAIVPLRVTDNSGRTVQIDFVLDTGFSGYLSLPPSEAASLHLTWANRTRINVAGEFDLEVDVYEVGVIWGAETVVADLLALDGDPLLGMSLLAGSDVHLQGEEGGLVEIDPA